MNTGKKLCSRLLAAGLTAGILCSAMPALPHAAAANTLTVGKNGTYSTIGAAVAAAANLRPSGESSRVTISIEPGTYREQIIINTPYLSFVNSNPAGGEVLVTWYYGIGYKYYSTASSGYFKASDLQARSAKAVAQRWGTSVRINTGASYFRAENITFENSFNRYVTQEELNDGCEPTYETIKVQRNMGLDAKAKSSTERAAAMCVEAPGCEFYKCSFISSQDTLYTANSAYFKACRIQGNTDYIFGSGDVVFDNCELCFGGYTDNAVGGYITAARQQNLGYLFWECTVTGAQGMKVGSGCFGRPWSNTAHVLFYNTKLQSENLISGAGWTSMSGVEPWQATFREYNTKTVSGGNVNTSQRVQGTVLSSCSATREQYLGNWKPYYFDFSGSSSGKAGAAVDTSAVYYIRNAATGLYLAAEDGSPAAGTNVIQRRKSGASAWQCKDGGSGYYYITLKSDPSLRLDLDYGKTDNGTNIGLYTDTQSDAQLFKFVTAAGGYEIATKPTNDESCIGIGSGDNAEQWECGGDGQVWQLGKAGANGTLIGDPVFFDPTNADQWSAASDARTGALIFNDREYTYSELPDCLVGAEYLRTACNSKNCDALLAEFTAAEDCTVYAVYDDRLTNVPQWCADWEPVSGTAKSSNGESFLLRAKEFAAGETVTLGSNGQTGACVNYAVFVQKSEKAVTTETTLPQTTTTLTETTTTVSAPPEDTSVTASDVRGDVDCNREINVADCVLFARFLAEDTDISVTMQGKQNADCNGDTMLNADDNTLILEYLAGLRDTPAL